MVVPLFWHSKTKTIYDRVWFIIKPCLILKVNYCAMFLRKPLTSEDELFNDLTYDSIPKNESHNKWHAIYKINSPDWLLEEEVAPLFSLLLSSSSSQDISSSKLIRWWTKTSVILINFFTGCNFPEVLTWANSRKNWNDVTRK